MGSDAGRGEGAPVIAGRAGGVLTATAALGLMLFPLASRSGDGAAPARRDPSHVVSQRSADRLDLEGVPGPRGSNELIVYSPGPGRDRTGTNEWGVEALVRDGIVLEIDGNNQRLTPGGKIKRDPVSGDHDRAHLPSAPACDIASHKAVLRRHKPDDRAGFAVRARGKQNGRGAQMHRSRRAWAVLLFLGERGFKLGKAGFERIGLFTRLLGHGLDRLEFLTAHEIDPGHTLAQTLTSGFARFASHSGNCASSAVGDFDEVGEDRVLALHGRICGDGPRACPEA